MPSLYVQINPSIFWGNHIKSFAKNSLVWSRKEMFAYDTHKADLFSFSEGESKVLKLLKHFANEAVRFADVVSKISQEFIERLIQEQILLTGKRRLIFQRANEAEIWLQANHFCNLACPGCATGMDVAQDKQKKFDLGIFERCLQKIVKDSKERGFTHLKVKMGGGEPTLNGLEFLTGVARFCTEYSDDEISLRPVLLTNGVALSEQLIQALNLLKIHSSVSTDPFRTIGKGRVRTFPIVLQNLKKMKEAEASVSAQLTVSSLNYQIVGEIYEQLADLEVHTHFSMFRPQTKAQFAYVRPEHVIQAMMDVYSRVFRRIEEGRFAGNITSFDYLRLSGVKDGVCGAGKTYIVLDVDGSVYSCHESIRTGKSCGNILHDKRNVFDMIDAGHAVPKRERYTASIGGTTYPFMWQGGFGCPWVVHKEKNTYDHSSDHVVQIYSMLAPIMLALSVKQQKSRRGVDYDCY